MSFAGFSQSDTLCLSKRILNEVASDLALYDGLKVDVVILENMIVDYQSIETAQKQQIANADSIAVIWERAAKKEIKNNSTLVVENKILKAEVKTVKTQRNISVGGILLIIVLIVAL